MYNFINDSQPNETFTHKHPPFREVTFVTLHLINLLNMTIISDDTTEVA